MELNSWKNKTDEHNKLELKEGMVVELRYHEKYLLRKVEGELILSGRDNWMEYRYNDDLTEKRDSFSNKHKKSQFDIMKVYESSAYTIEDLFDDDYLTRIWERKEQKKERKDPKKMTVAEISNALGAEVEVVDSLDISIEVSDHEDGYDCR